MSKKLLRLEDVKDAWDGRKIGAADVEKRMEFNYWSEKTKKLISEGLNLLGFSMGKMYQTGLDVRREFFRDYVKSSNGYVGVVAIMESLPDTVWRAILHECNIDYMSDESFLRRLNNEQVELIRLNYEDLFVSGRIPRVLAQRRCFREWTVESLLAEPLDYHRRYNNRAAWSHNLLHLDFGYNAYPKGKNDDTLVMGEKSLRKFLSVKNHADDFSVNTDYGRYFWFYKTARSNYVVNSDVIISLKKHICPGFWVTLMLHLIFWIISPVAFLVIVGLTPHGIPGVLACIFSLPIIFWLVIAALKYVLLEVIPQAWWDRGGERVVEFAEKRIVSMRSTFWISKMVLLLVVSGAMVVAGIWLSFLLFESLYFFLPISKIVAAWLVLMAQIIVGYSLYYKFFPYARKSYYKPKETDSFPKFREFPTYFRWPLYVTAVSIPLFSAIAYREALAWFYVQTYEVVTAVVSVVGVPMLVLLPFIIIGPAILFVGGRAMSTKAKERLFYFIDNYSYRIVQIVAFLLAAIMIFDIGVAYQYMGLVKTCVSLVLLFVMYVVFLKTWSLSLRIDPQFDELSAIAHKVKSHMKKDFLVDIHMFQRNKWLRTIPKEKWEEVAYKAYNFVNEITCTYEARDNAIRQLILYMNERTLSLLEECRDQLCLIDNREKIFYQIVKNGMRFDAAREFVEKNEKRRKVNTRRLVLTLKTIFFPLLFIWMLCKAVYALIRDFMLLTKSINKLCPYVVEEKTVSVPERY